MSNSIENLAMQLLYLQTKLTQKEVSDWISQMKSVDQTTSEPSSSYLDQHAAEIETQGLFRQLISLFEDHTKMFESIQADVINAVEFLCSGLKAKKGDDIKEILDKPFDNLPLILEEAEEIGGLDSELDFVYENISELREVGSRIDATHERLKESLDKLYEITRLQGRLQ